MKVKEAVVSAAVVLISVLIVLALGEVVLRVKNSSMKNYDIEMWRYARDLKKPSSDAILGHDHLPNSSALLESVVIRTNSWGLRGGPVGPLTPGKRRILVLGGSITLGWGVPESETMTARLQDMFQARGEDVEVLNAGIGNYNAQRYVERFMTELTGLEPTDILVHYFLRDAEYLGNEHGNFLLRNSELAVTAWIVWNRFIESGSEKGLVEHYKEVYDPKAPGFIAMQQSLGQLAAYSKQHNIRLYLAMVPDVHQITDYPFLSIDKTMEEVAKTDGYAFVDTLPAFAGLKPEQVWAMPGDPHPNALGHELMAKAIFPLLDDVR